MQGDIASKVTCGIDWINIMYIIQNSGIIAGHSVRTDQQHNAIVNHSVILQELK